MAALQKAHERTTYAYSSQLDRVMVEPRQWEAGFGTTHRRNGEVVVGSYRNIWDLGNAAKSKQVDVQGFTSTFTWDGLGETPIVIVHEGATLGNGAVIPPRPFTQQAASEMNWGKTFKEAFNASL